MVGAGGARFVTAATMLPSGSAFALASAAADAPPTAIALLADDDVHVVAGAAAVGAVAAARPPMRLKRSMISSKGNPQITS